MKARLGSVVVVGLASAFVLGCASQPPAKVPALVVTTPVVTLQAGSMVTMYGTGFVPKQEVNLVFKDPGGGLSGISGGLKPAPVPNADGAWAATWDISPYVSTFRPGVGLLTVNDANWKAIGEAPVLLVAPPPKPAPKPEAAKPEAAKPEAKPPAKPGA